MAKVRRTPRRGDVYWVALDPALGSEIQIRSLDKSRLRSRIETLSADEVTAVEEAIRITLGLWP